jgi:hypothetical protein
MQTPGTQHLLDIHSISTTERFCWPARVGGLRSLVPSPESLWREISRGSIFRLFTILLQTGGRSHSMRMVTGEARITRLT